jgi:uncharacterized protein (DUF4415 family)
VLDDPMVEGKVGSGNGGIKTNMKARITIHLDRDIISYFKRRASQTTKGYQTLINEALREYTGLQNQPSMMTNLVKRVKRLEEELSRQVSD